MSTGWRRWLGVVRKRAEGACFLVLVAVLAPWWCVAVAAAAVRGLGPNRLPDAWARWRRFAGRSWVRWGALVGQGLFPIRAPWWVQFTMERTADVWRYTLLMEVLDLLNLAVCTVQPRPPDGVRRVLSIKFAHFGDALHVVPALRALREALPDVRSDLLVGPWCEDLARRIDTVADVLVYAPRVTIFHRGDRRACPGLWREWGLLMELRRRRYDVVYATSTMNFIEKVVIHACNPAHSIGTECGLRLYPDYGRATRVPYDADAYEAERVGSLLSVLDVPGCGHALSFPVRPDEAGAAEARWREHGLEGPGPVVAIAPGAGWPGKIWPPERFGEAGRRLAAETGARLVLIGSPGDRELAASVASAAGGEVVDLTGATSWGETAAVLARCDLLLCNDSGPMHLAAAVGTPTVHLFGPTRAAKWAPRGPRHRLLQHSMECHPCVPWHPLTVCVRGNACIKRIGVEEVAEAALALLATRSESNAP